MKTESELDDQTSQAKMEQKRKRKHTGGNKDTNTKEMNTQVSEREKQRSEGKVGVQKDSVISTLDATSVTHNMLNPALLANDKRPQEESPKITQGTAVLSHGVKEFVQEGKTIDNARYDNYLLPLDNFCFVL